MREWQEAMSSREFAEWIAFAQLHPFGEARADLRMGILAALTANIHRNPDESDAFTAEQFMPQFQKPPAGEPEDEEPATHVMDVAAKIDLIFSALAMKPHPQPLSK